MPLDTMHLDRRRFHAWAVASGAALLSAPRSVAARLARSSAVADLPTPALLLDLDAFERNLQTMARHARDAGVGLRPHSKTHKCPEIAKRQMKAGAVGLCCAKVSEAEALADDGLGRLLITSPVATPEKVRRVVELAQRVDELIMLVDHPESVAAFEAAAASAGVVLDVVVGLDTGTRRTGIAPGAPAVALAREIERADTLRLRGLQAYAGHVMHVEGHAERKAASEKALRGAFETRKLFHAEGLEAGILTGGGTGTYDIDATAGLSDLQVGSYCFMDVQYRQIGGRRGPVFDDFEPALFVLATAISQPVPELITVDAGLKAFAYEPKSKPEFHDRDGLIYHYGGDEHGIVQFTGEPTLARGDKARLLVSHCDPTVNLYDELVVVQGDEVKGTWPITGRGRSQ